MTTKPLIVFIRHGHSVANTMSLSELAGTGMAMTDFPLTDRGRQQATISRHFVADKFGRFDRIIVSDFLRALQTALIIFPKREMIIDPRLGELNYGVWSCMTNEQLREHLPDEIRRINSERPYYYRPTDGESWQDAEVRIQAVIDELLEKVSGKIALVGHGHWFNLFQRLVENLTIEEIEQRFYNHQYVRNASITVYELSDGRFVRHTDTVVPWEGQL